MSLLQEHIGRKVTLKRRDGLVGLDLVLEVWVLRGRVSRARRAEAGQAEHA
jgi:hypothetical protein